MECQVSPQAGNDLTHPEPLTNHHYIHQPISHCLITNPSFHVLIIFLPCTCLSKGTQRGLCPLALALAAPHDHYCRSLAATGRICMRAIEFWKSVSMCLTCGVGLSCGTWRDRPETATRLTAPSHAVACIHTPQHTLSHHNARPTPLRVPLPHRLEAIPDEGHEGRQPRHAHTERHTETHTTEDGRSASLD